jgi:isocitrate/isopropylmalate dehydrogenase
MKTRRIAVLPGDGVGPEVIEEGVRMLRSNSYPATVSLSRSIP